jgi:hypothetical protein
MDELDFTRGEDHIKDVVRHHVPSYIPLLVGSARRIAAAGSIEMGHLFQMEGFYKFTMACVDNVYGLFRARTALVWTTRLENELVVFLTRERTIK